MRRQRLIAKCKRIAGEVVELKSQHNCDTEQVVNDLVAQEEPVGSVAFIIIVKIVLFIIEHMLLSGGSMPDDEMIIAEFDIEE